MEWKLFQFLFLSKRCSTQQQVTKSFWSCSPVTCGVVCHRRKPANIHESNRHAEKVSVYIFFHFIQLPNLNCFYLKSLKRALLLRMTEILKNVTFFFFSFQNDLILLLRHLETCLKQYSNLYFISNVWNRLFLHFYPQSLNGDNSQNVILLKHLNS